MKLKTAVLFLFSSFFIFFYFFSQKNSAQVIKIEKKDKQTVLVQVKSNQKTINIQLNQPLNKNFNIRQGDRIVISSTKINNQDVYFIADFYRLPSLLLLTGFFILTIIIVVGKKSIGAFISLFFSFFVIFNSILPNILSGANPIVAAIIGCLIIIPFNYYLTHGLNKKTTVAVISSLIILIFSGFLVWFFIYLSKITGAFSEETGFLSVLTKKEFDFQGIYFASVLIGLLGVLDDLSINQASVIEKLIINNQKAKKDDIYQLAINVGQDHINSIINTLILVYTSASMPLLLLFLISNKSYSEVLNYEIITAEIVRTLTASISLIISVPLTTFLGVNLLVKK